MPHVKQQARDAVQVLLTGLPTSGARLFPAKRLPWDNAAGQMPGIAFYLDAETVFPIDKEGRQRRDMVLTVDMAGRSQDDLLLDDQLIAMETEVQAALGGDPKLGGLLSEKMRLLRVAPPPPDASLGDAYMVRRHEYALSVIVMEGDPTQVAP
ncbi:hypothetical protein [Niveispirillum sp.]|uniref:hypothetical protein n=1 Tax=Niveispirillum sp. TaxID=1917217 RepID=UPI001B4F4DED|nr:hypothetical protein [Niveispirillum sp.]MBP7339415.1 hypothetical protein [Niveispirillum sp.]